MRIMRFIEINALVGMGAILTVIPYRIAIILGILS